MFFFITTLILIIIGLYAIVTKTNLIRIIIGFAILEYAINFFFALVGFKKGALAPIITQVDGPKNFVDPIPQALVLTAIVIGLATTALMLSFAIKLYQKHKTFDITKIKELKG
ncbi:cation:proton antiporter [candidate division WOR-3 bacterium]|uniref:Cation:proton antiporter n=1 Tax=candidate division WOR-3 bacterium TaxID=2052148 RepID=A0A660SM53_UNCW3|nr:MAG: cation:proton antiporter [candidate division WOR-3 bacterium]